MFLFKFTGTGGTARPFPGQFCLLLLLMDATVAPQNITFSINLKLFNTTRVKSQEIIDFLYDPKVDGGVKVTTYRQIARKAFFKYRKKKE